MEHFPDQTSNPALGSGAPPKHPPAKGNEESMPPMTGELVNGKGPRGHAVIAWILIILAVGYAFYSRNVTQEPAIANQDDPMGVILMRMQAQYIVGAKEESGGGDLLYGQSLALNIGSLGQRQRFVIFAAELVGSEIAAEHLSQLDERIKQEQQLSSTPPFELTESQQQIQDILRLLYPPDLAGSAVDLDADQSLIDRIDTLSEAQQTLLVNELDWFGKLALLPLETPNTQARVDMIEPASRVLFTLVGALIGIGGAGVLGLVGLIIVLVMILTGRLRCHFDSIQGHHGLYAETFALWMILFYAIQFPASLLAQRFPTWSLGFVVIGFFMSLLCLLWPVVRGLSWKQVRQDIGLTLGPSPVLEPLIGMAGYMMALPLLGIGVLITFGLILLQQGGITGSEDTFTPSGGPAHPIVLEIANGSWLPRLQILLLAAVAAPIVEETMFRGVLYRHLRQVSSRLGVALSVLMAGTINAFIFAAIHPQGWVAIPALMSLAYAFVLLREWRGSVIPSIIVHAISNGLVMSLLMVVLGQQN